MRRDGIHTNRGGPLGLDREEVHGLAFDVRARDAQIVPRAAGEAILDRGLNSMMDEQRL